MTATVLRCSKCERELREGDEATVYDVERRIDVRGQTVTFTDVQRYECFPDCQETNS